MDKKYKVNKGKQFGFMYYDTQMDKQFSCAVFGDIVHLTSKGIDILTDGTRFPTINLIPSITQALQSGVLTEVTE